MALIRRGARWGELASITVAASTRGWMLPDTLRLADYGLGHDEWAKEPQPVASVLGSRHLP